MAWINIIGPQLIETRSKQHSQRKEAIRELETRIDEAMNRLSGQMQGIEITQQAAVEAGGPHTEFTKVLEQQNSALAAFFRIVHGSVVEYSTEHG